MASALEVTQLPDERCPDCGSRFAQEGKDKGKGVRWHLQALPKRDRKTKRILMDADRNRIICGGTTQSWGKGHRSEENV
jgi:hypothetical protein